MSPIRVDEEQDCLTIIDTINSINYTIMIFKVLEHLTVFNRFFTGSGACCAHGTASCLCADVFLPHPLS